MAGTGVPPSRGWDVGYDLLPREYRMRRSRMLMFLWLIFAGTLSLPGAMLADDDLSASIAIPFTIAWVTFMGWLFYAALRCSTAADIKAIHVRGMVRRRRLAWADVQDGAPYENDGHGTLWLFPGAPDGLALSAVQHFRSTEHKQLPVTGIFTLGQVIAG